MTIEFRCGQCGQLLRVPDQSAGKNARCPKCQALMLVPMASAPAPGPAATPSPTPTPTPAPVPQAPSQFGPFGAPAPQKPADPFAFLGPSGGQGGAPPPKNPFGDGGTATSLGGPPAPFGSSAPSVNPYASPGGSYQTMPEQYGAGQRPGLPWEVMKQSIGVWWKTAGMVLGSPGAAFSRMRIYGGLGQPMVYTVYGLAQVLVLLLCLGLPIGLLIVLSAAGGGGGADEVGSALLGCIVVAGVVLVGGVIYIALIATVGMLISAAFYHLMLMIVGGARNGFEATFRVNSYAFASLAWLMFIPYIGGTIASIWLIVLLIIGLSKAHQISGGKAALAVLLPYMVICGGMLALFGVLAIVGAVGANAN
jgi:hypothetical protein